MNAMTEIPNSAAIARVLARKKKLEDEIREIDLFISLFKKFAADDDVPMSVSSDMNVNSVGGSDSANEAVQIDRGIQQSEPARSGMPQRDFEDIVSRILLENGKPMQPAEILDRMHAMGRHLKGTNEFASVNTKLWRARGVIRKIPGSGYWLIDTPCPAVGYQPPET